jgi:branched-chain amino acid transport system substrate-binding protein
MGEDRIPDQHSTLGNRREFIKAVGMGGVALTTALAGCASDTGSGSGGGGNASTGTDSNATTNSSGGGGNGGGGNTSTIGMANGLTGSLSTFGERNKRGKRIALSDVNGVGVKGGELEIVVEDTQSTSQGGTSAAQKLINQNGVPLLIGAVGSGVTLSIYQSVVQGTDAVQISQNSTSPTISEFSGLLRTAPDGQAQARVMADIISQDGHDSVAVTWINNAYGEAVTQAFVDAYSGEVSYNTPHDQERSSYNNIVTEMENTNANAWAFITYQPEFTTMAREIYSNGSGEGVRFYGGDSTKGPGILENTPDGSINGMKTFIPSANLDSGTYERFANDFQSEFGEEPTSWSAFCYDAVVVSAIATQTANEFTGTALSNVVRDVTRPPGQQVDTYKAAHDILVDGGGASDVDYQGVSGPINFNQRGDPTPFLQVFEVQNGEYASVNFVKG